MDSTVGLYSIHPAEIVHLKLSRDVLRFQSVPEKIFMSIRHKLVRSEHPLFAG
jgi:hypothetical protein